MKPSEQAGVLADILWELVHARYPFLKPPKRETWADDIDKINRIDGYDWQTIAAALHWSQDDSFWRQQIRSGANLRKHFEKLLIQITEQQTRKPRVYHV